VRSVGLEVVSLQEPRLGGASEILAVDGSGSCKRNGVPLVCEEEIADVIRIATEDRRSVAGVIPMKREGGSRGRLLLVASPTARQDRDRRQTENQLAHVFDLLLRPGLERLGR